MHRYLQGFHATSNAVLSQRVISAVDVAINISKGTLKSPKIDSNLTDGPFCIPPPTGKDPNPKRKALLALAFKQDFFQVICSFSWKFIISPATTLAAVAFTDHFMFDPQVPEDTAHEYTHLLMSNHLNFFEKALNEGVRELFTWSLMSRISIRLGVESWNLSQRLQLRFPMILEAIDGIKPESMEADAEKDRPFCAVLSSLFQVETEFLWGLTHDYLMQSISSYQYFLRRL